MPIRGETAQGQCEHQAAPVCVYCGAHVGPHGAALPATRDHIYPVGKIARRLARRCPEFQVSRARLRRLGRWRGVNSATACDCCNGDKADRTIIGFRDWLHQCGDPRSARVTAFINALMARHDRAIWDVLLHGTGIELVIIDTARRNGDDNETSKAYRATIPAVASPAAG